MNRREFIKASIATIAAIGSPIGNLPTFLNPSAEPVNAIFMEKWGRLLFNYALENMQVTSLMPER